VGVVGVKTFAAGAGVGAAGGAAGLLVALDARGGRPITVLSIGVAGEELGLVAGLGAERSFGSSVIMALVSGGGEDGLRRVEGSLVPIGGVFDFLLGVGESPAGNTPLPKEPSADVLFGSRPAGGVEAFGGGGGALAAGVPAGGVEAFGGGGGVCAPPGRGKAPIALVFVRSGLPAGGVEALGGGGGALAAGFPAGGVEALGGGAGYSARAGIMAF